MPKGEDAMAVQVTRKEIKYRIPLLEYKYLERALQAQLQADTNNRAEGYTVISLYFDSLDDGDRSNVLDGLEVRKKIRLRIYSPQDATAKMEYKQKQGGDQTKYSITVSKTEALNLISGDYRALLDYDEPVAGRMYGEMMQGVYRPKVLIAYERRAFVYPVNRVRITFDTNVRASQVNLNPFDPDVSFAPVMAPGIGVFEVKYDGFLPTFIQKALAKLDALPGANSKYLQARALYMG